MRYFFKSELTLLKIILFVFLENDLKLKICQGIVTTPVEVETSSILGHYYRKKEKSISLSYLL